MLKMTRHDAAGQRRLELEGGLAVVWVSRENTAGALPRGSRRRDLEELAKSRLRVQAVLPGATATNFWAIAGTPVEQLPNRVVMKADDLVDAALAGLDQGEFVTIPALPHAADREAFEAARQALLPNLSRATPAARYQVVCE
jgi:hypothetical protein